jgi:hypothetical protein
MDAELIDCFEMFRQAVQANQDLHAQPASDPHDLTLMADTVLAGRLRLFRCLVRQGWTPAPEVQLLMESDALLIAETDDREFKRATVVTGTTGFTSAAATVQRRHDPPDADVQDIVSGGSQG